MNYAHLITREDTTTNSEGEVTEEEWWNIPAPPSSLMEWMKLLPINQFLDLVGPTTDKASKKPLWFKDQFVQTVGVISNRAFKTFMDKKYFSEASVPEKYRSSWCSKILDLRSQKNFWVDKFNEDLTLKDNFVNTFISEFQEKLKPEPVPEGMDPALPSGDISLNIVARIVHTFKEAETHSLWADLFRVVPNEKATERLNLDCKDQRFLQLLMRLLNFVNSPNETGVFYPQNMFTDNERLALIRPDMIPQVPVTLDKFNKLTVNKIRGKFTIFVNNFKRSGDLEEDADHATGDEQFFIKFCSTDPNPIYLYMYLLFDRSIPTLLSREAAPGNQLEIGVPGSGKKRSLPSGSNDDGTRKIIHIMSDEELAIFKQTELSKIARDEAFKRHCEEQIIASVFKRQQDEEQAKHQKMMCAYKMYEDIRGDARVPESFKVKLRDVWMRLSGDYFALDIEADLARHGML